MDKLILKQISILSAFVGVLLGVLTLIPVVGKITFIALICFASALVIIFMYKVGLIEELSTKDSIIWGAIIGFISFIAFSAIYLPALALLGNSFQLYAYEGVTFALRAGTPGVIIMMVIFVGVLSATINAFSAFIVSYLISFIKGNKNV